MMVVVVVIMMEIFCLYFGKIVVHELNLILIPEVAHTTLYLDT